MEYYDQLLPMIQNLIALLQWMKMMLWISLPVKRIQPRYNFKPQSIFNSILVHLIVNVFLQAFMNGKMKVRGSMKAAQKFQQFWAEENRRELEKPQTQTKSNLPAVNAHNNDSLLEVSFFKSSQIFTTHSTV